MICANNKELKRTAKSLLKVMRNLPDDRDQSKIKHGQAEVLTCVLLGLLSGKENIKRCLKWCRNREKMLSKFLNLPYGIPSEATVCRILASVDHLLFCYEFATWAFEIIDSRKRHIAIDGKAIRGSRGLVQEARAVLTMNAFDVESKLCIGAIPLLDKSNEMKTIPEILKILMLEKSVVTIDAVGTYTDIMEDILENKANFVLQVKMNQKTACTELHQMFDILQQDFKKKNNDVNYTVNYPKIMQSYELHKVAPEKNRDRVEYREIEICKSNEILTNCESEWQFIKTIGRTTQVRVPIEKDENGNDVTVSKEVFITNGSLRKPKPEKSEEIDSNYQVVGLISNMDLTATQMLEYKRAHWNIENCLHYVLDYSFHEDRSRAKKSKFNLSLLRKIAYNVLRIISIKEFDNKESISTLMDEFSDNPSFMEKYIFAGIESLT